MAANFCGLTELKEIDECICFFFFFRVFILSNIGSALWSCTESFECPAVEQEVIAAKLFQFDTPHPATANVWS